MKIRPYRKEDETGWVHCRVLSFLDTAYYDHVLRSKEHYDNPAIELIAEINGVVVGLIDVEYELEPGKVCSGSEKLGGMIWHIAVHPDYQSKGIGKCLLEKAEKIAHEKGLQLLEVWTRDDVYVNKWYEQHGFVKSESYLHVFLDSDEEMDNAGLLSKDGLRPMSVFAHYTGTDIEQVRSQYNVFMNVPVIRSRLEGFKCSSYYLKMHGIEQLPMKIGQRLFAFLLKVQTEESGLSQFERR